MSATLDDTREESRREDSIGSEKKDKRKDEAKYTIEIVKKMLAKGIVDVREISEYSDLSIDEIEKIKLDLTNLVGEKMNTLLAEMKEESRIEGIKEANFKADKRMLDDGLLTTQQISEYLGLSVDEVEDIKMS